MNSYQTIQAALDAAAKNPDIKYIIEIEPGLPNIGRFICARGSAEVLRNQLSKNPMKEIKGIIGTAVDFAKEAQDIERVLLIKNVPGLEELRDAIANEKRYASQFSKMMEDGDNDGARPPSRVRISSKSMATQFPVAASYIKAENWQYASHFVKAGAGRRAVERIKNGDPHETVIAEMKTEWSDYCSEQD